MTEYHLSDLPERLRSRILINPETGCWERQGPTNWAGYVQVRHKGRRWQIHTLVWTLLVEPVPEGLRVGSRLRGRVPV